MPEMDKLWSPWRSRYIESFKDEPSDSPVSLFTRLLNENNDRKNYILYRSVKSFIIMNLYPYNSGHLMIVPYKQVSELSELDDETRIDLFNMLELSCNILNQSLKPHGFNIGVNLGRVSGAGVENHLHFHVVPRWNGDTNFMPVLNDVKVISEAMDETYEKLLNALSKCINS